MPEPKSVIKVVGYYYLSELCRAMFFLHGCRKCSPKQNYQVILSQFPGWYAPGTQLQHLKMAQCNIFRWEGQKCKTLESTSSTSIAMSPAVYWAQLSVGRHVSGHDADTPRPPSSSSGWYAGLISVTSWAACTWACICLLN